jgi:1,4-alpha-glucan branching enzyme
MQPYVVALYTGKGIPMLWHGQEFGENWGLPGSGIGRNLFERPVHWEYFYDAPGRALIRLHRIMGRLRRDHRALRSRGYFYYFYDPEHLQRRVIAFRREAAADAGQPAESIIVVLNFSNQQAEVWIPFPTPGQWVEQIDGVSPRHSRWAERSVAAGHSSIQLRSGLPPSVTSTHCTIEEELPACFACVTWFRPTFSYGAVAAKIGPPSLGIWFNVYQLSVVQSERPPALTNGSTSWM